jgi:ABC-2 type transport system permease protein
MARYFVRLKIALFRNALRVGWRRRTGVIVGLFVWCWVVVGCLVFLLSGTNPSVSLPLVFDSFFVGWLLFPLMGLGTDETLDPSRLALLPLSRRTLMVGLLAAGLVGLAPIATLLSLSGALAHTPSAGAAAIAFLAVLAELVLCIVASRAVTTALSGILRSRRGKDLLVFVIAIVAVIPALAGQVIPRLAVKATRHGLSVSASRSLFWLPSGWAARAILQARHGQNLPALMHLAGVVAVAAAFAWLWSVTLQRALTTAESGAGRTARKAPDLFAAPLGWLPRTRVGAVAAKELRYTWRDPRRRAALVTVLLLIGLPAVALTHGQPSPAIVLVAAAGALVFGLQALNQFGTDGAAYWINVASGRDPAVDFKGKNLASAALGLTVVAVAALALAVFTGGWIYVPAAILIGAGVSGVSLAVANQVSVLAPFPLPDAVTNLWAGPGCLTALSGLLALGIVMALLAPVAAGVVLSLALWPGGLEVVCVAAALYGWGLWRLGLAMATRRLRLRELDCLEIVSGARGA